MGLTMNKYEPRRLATIGALAHPVSGTRKTSAQECALLIKHGADVGIGPGPSARDLAKILIGDLDGPGRIRRQRCAFRLAKAVAIGRILPGPNDVAIGHFSFPLCCWWELECALHLTERNPSDFFAISF